MIDKKTLRLLNSNELPVSLMTITGGLFVWLIANPLMQDGMFMDGLLYASVSRNLSMGMGTWLEPHYSNTLFDHFHEQPPLMIWLQSLFFFLPGDTIYPERIYSLFMGMIGFVLIIILWEFSFQDLHLKNLKWLPVLLWLFVPTISWGLINNVQENTMVVFDMLSILMLLRFLKNKNRLDFVLSVLFCFAASFTKGLQGLFPIAVPFCYWICFRKFSFGRMIEVTIGFTGIILAIYVLLFQVPGIRENFSEYFISRLSGFPRTPNVNTDNRVFLLQRMFIEMSLPLILSGIYLLVTFRFAVIDLRSRQFSLFFFLIAFTASFPLMISFEQRSFYLITSIPFYMLSLASLIAPSLFSHLSIVQTKPMLIGILKIFSLVLLLSGIVFTAFNAGKIKRDRDIIQDVLLIKNKLGTNLTISVSEKNWDEWYLHGYFQRYSNISLGKNDLNDLYFIEPKRDSVKSLNGYTRVETGTKYFDLYKKKNM